MDASELLDMIDRERAEGRPIRPVGRYEAGKPLAWADLLESGVPADPTEPVAVFSIPPGDLSDAHASKE